jgi:hypothetical protein
MQAHVSAEEAYYVVLRTVVAGKQTNWVSGVQLLQIPSMGRQLCALVHSSQELCQQHLAQFTSQYFVGMSPMMYTGCHGPHGAAAAADGRL